MRGFCCVEFVFAFGRKFKVLLSGANFGKSATTFVSSVVFFLCVSEVQAGVDLELGATTRSYPLAGVLEADLGYGHLLWGKTGSPWYGYLRAELSGSTAVTYNSGMALVELYPLSFFGIRGGGESIQNEMEYSAYACETLTCKGRFYRSFVEGELGLGAGRFFVQGRWRRERWTQKDSLAGDFVDPTSGLLMESSGDSQTVYQGFAGVRLTPTWSVIGSLRYATNDLGEISRFPSGILRWRRGRWVIGIGGGVFESELKKPEGSAVGFIRWEALPGLALQ